MQTQLCFPRPRVNLPMPTEAQAPLIIKRYARPFSLKSLQREAAAAGCYNWHVLHHPELIRFLVDHELRAQS